MRRLFEIQELGTKEKVKIEKEEGRVYFHSGEVEEEEEEEEEEENEEKENEEEEEDVFIFIRETGSMGSLSIRVRWDGTGQITTKDRGVVVEVVTQRQQIGWRGLEVVTSYLVKFKWGEDKKITHGRCEVSS